MNDKFKTNFNFYSNIFLLFIIFVGTLSWADTNGIWHFAEDVRPGIFGENEGDVVTPFEFFNPVQYLGVELDLRYINEGETGDSILDNTIDSSEIQDGTIGLSDLNVGSVDDYFATIAYVNSNSGGSLSCVTIAKLGTTNYLQVDCTAGYVVTGGGCYMDEDDRPHWSKPLDNGWNCYNANQKVLTGWARCCKII